MYNYLFIDRDGTLIEEPHDFQVDSLEKLTLMPKVIPALIELQKFGFHFVMVTNQDGLGTESFPEHHFQLCQNKLIEIFQSQGIEFEDILICPHFQEDNCLCRKPKTQLLEKYIKHRLYNLEGSYVIGDRETDLQLAENLNVLGLQIGSQQFPNWHTVRDFILYKNRKIELSRKTNETDIHIILNLDCPEPIEIKTGLNFFDHMLEQLAKHGGFSLKVIAKGDLHVDEHHVVEDCAIVLGQAFAKALGHKRGIARYGFLLPMDEASAQIALDLSGRSYFNFEGEFTREKVGDLPTELVTHFFRTFAENLPATLHIKVLGHNNHHMIEVLFKSLGRVLRQAITKIDKDLPSTKGTL